MTASASIRTAKTTKTTIALVVALALAIIGFATSCGSSNSSSSKLSNPSTSAVPRADPALKPSGLATIAESALPAEARDVIHRIDSGGTFKYRQDGVTFQNREGLLPAEPRGYYREYTVTMPGASDRGPRRLILGRQGQLYYTPDHYRSFLWVVRGGAT